MNDASFIASNQRRPREVASDVAKSDFQSSATLRYQFARFQFELDVPDIPAIVSRMTQRTGHINEAELRSVARGTKIDRSDHAMEDVGFGPRQVLERIVTGCNQELIPGIGG